MVDSERSCPSCGALVAPELDVDLHYFECEQCGYAFGWLRSGHGSADPSPAGDLTCPTGMRLVGVAAPEKPVVLQIGKPRA